MLSYQGTLTRRDFLKTSALLSGILTLPGTERILAETDPVRRPNILFIICDQYRADAIEALGNYHLKTSNIDRLVHRGVNFSKAYEPTPECIPSRYTMITGCDAPLTGFYNNDLTPKLISGQSVEMEQRCGDYLARVIIKLKK
jgi:choline-sulfatase